MQRFITYTFNNIMYRRLRTQFVCHVFINGPGCIVFPPEKCFSLLSLMTNNFENDQNKKIKSITKVDNNSLIRYNKPYSFKLEHHLPVVFPNSLSNALEEWCKKHMKWHRCDTILCCGNDQEHSRLVSVNKCSPREEFDQLCFNNQNYSRHMCGLHYVYRHSVKSKSNQDGIIMFGNYFE